MWCIRRDARRSAADSGHPGLLPRTRSLLLLLCLLACVDRPAAVAQELRPTPVRSSGEAGEPLAPGDLVRLRIWREPDLSGDFTVDPDGLVVLPKLGPVDVTRESPEVLVPRIVDLYEAYLENPSIEVLLLRRIQVLGAVRTPGLYPVDGTMTVGDVVALAGGATPEGRTDQVELIRQGKRIAVRLSAATRIDATPLRSGDQLFVRERRWGSRNIGIVTGLATSLAWLLASVLTK